MVELLGIVMHRPSSLLEVHEFLMLLPHHTCGDVVGAKDISLEIKLSIIANLSNGKCDNSIIMENTVNSVRTVWST
jgi:hypothetical protein